MRVCVADLRAIAGRTRSCLYVSAPHTHTHTDEWDAFPCGLLLHRHSRACFHERFFSLETRVAMEVGGGL